MGELISPHLLMRVIFHTLAVHLFFIIFFAYLYYYFSSHFDNNKAIKFNPYNEESTLDTIIEYFLFSTTIQAGVGISEIVPISNYAKLLMIIQQLIMLSIHIITIYAFTN